MRPKNYCQLTFILALTFCHQVSSQDDVTRSIYGKGVHAFYRGNISAARESLDEAIAYGSQDPRAYYFRGLTRLRGGDTHGAEADFNTAARLEYTGAENYDVDMSLSRIQGANRMSLERVRRATRAAVRSAPSRLPLGPSEPAVPEVAPEPNDLFDETQLDIDNSEDLPPVRELPADPGDPFGDDPAQPKGFDDPFQTGSAAGNRAGSASSANSGDIMSAVMRALLNTGGKAIPAPAVNLPLPGGESPAIPAEVAEEDPFGEAPAADGEDPFGGDPFGADGGTAPAGETPSEPPATDDDPFGGDPFGEAPAAEPAPPADGEDPFGDDPFGGGGGGAAPTAGDDPFATAPAAEAPAAGDGGEPPAAEEDPFGDDPFGA